MLHDRKNRLTNASTFELSFVNPFPVFKRIYLYHTPLYRIDQPVLSDSYRSEPFQRVSEWISKSWIFQQCFKLLFNPVYYRFIFYFLNLVLKLLR